jgi:hypothetical protein
MSEYWDGVVRFQGCGGGEGLMARGVWVCRQVWKADPKNYEFAPLLGSGKPGVRDRRDWDMSDVRAVHSRLHWTMLMICLYQVPREQSGSSSGWS